MFVRRLVLRDFRNYQTADVEFGPDVWILVGPNGQGKTNLAEAIRFLSVFRSHRVSSQGPLLRSGADQAVLRCTVVHADRRLQIDVAINRGRPNEIKVNRTASRVADAAGQLTTVLFAPEDLALVRGAPDGRRAYLDAVCAEARPSYAGILADYDRALKQRNSLLKSAKIQRLDAGRLGTLDVWDERLSTLGARLVVERATMAARLRGPLSDIYRTIAATEATTDARLISNVASNDEGTAVQDALDEGAVARAFATQLHQSRVKDLDRGLTGVGPHRDDLLLTIEGLPAREYASHGESWSLALALRLASASVLREGSLAGDPVLILDDVFAELDEARRTRLASLIGEYEQVVITAAVLDDLPDFPGRRVHVLPVHAGTVGDVHERPDLDTAIGLDDGR